MGETVLRDHHGCFTDVCPFLNFLVASIQKRRFLFCRVQVPFRNLSTGYAFKLQCGLGKCHTSESLNLFLFVSAEGK